MRDKSITSSKSKCISAESFNRCDLREEGTENKQRDSKYSIKHQLVNIPANINLAQLYEVSPELHSKTIKLLRGMESSKNVDLIENDLITNCKAIIQINGIRCAVVIDTGAACSVISKKLAEKIKLDSAVSKSLIVVTADGKKHQTFGIVSAVPVMIANQEFTVDLLIMDIHKETLILGTDWLKKHNTVLDLKQEELLLPKDRFDVVLSISTSSEKDKINGIDDDTSWKVFGIGKEVIY
ncbi:hypothetical protein BB560_004015 [Smittium megazygosporum]|uniref:Aspartic peptidase DDI1-type domain-containing protein n=1 Tax=Smittium megazygosporum TaxID=133381 RepID=A0A2T9ZAF2_9FUNG|nr:hypothetical protein BB560_004015 [Smittium megazygosporum]